MKHSFGSYDIYRINRLSVFTIRMKVNMKDRVDGDILRNAVNVATRRYPYFMVRLTVSDDGAFEFVPNDNDIAVLKTADKNPKFNTAEVGFHQLYADYEDKTVYFNISHTLTGGKGFTPWVMTCLYEYIVEKYGVCPDAPAIRKPGSELLEGEASTPSIEMTDGSVRYPLERFKGAKSLIKDYISSIINPVVRSNEYYELVFDQKDIMKFAKGSDNSVLSLFEVLMFKTMAKAFPKAEKFVGEASHNTAADLGIPNSYANVNSHVLFLFKREMLDWDIEKLGTIARGSIVLQTDPDFCRNEIRRRIELSEGIDKVDGYREKARYEKKHSLSFGKDAVHGTYIVNYTGYLDWGEVADYIESFFYVVDGHQMLEISAIKDKIFCCYMQVVRTDRYISIFRKVLEEAGIPYTIRGPFKKNLVEHSIPGKD